MLIFRVNFFGFKTDFIMHHFFSVAIIGRPNVGKSTLFNRIVGFRQAVTSKEPGTTRDRVIADVSWNNKDFTIIDTAGVLFDFFGFKDEEIERLSQEQISESLEEADLILCVVSYKDGLTDNDREIIRKVRKTGKKVILVCNKADNLEEEGSCDNFLKAGIKEIYPISAFSGRRVAQLLDRVTRDISSQKPERSNAMKMAIIGRPNVGKSTLFNALVGKERSIVSSVAGTTRDSINEILSIDGKKVEIIDTAGLRKRGKREVGVEKFSVFRTLDSIDRSDIVLLVVDAEEGLTRGDAHLAQLAVDKKKKVVVIINKIDLLERKVTGEIKNLYRYKFINKIKTFAISAKGRENIDLIINEIRENI